MVVLVVSDIHLGYLGPSGSDDNAFKLFLQQTTTRDEVDTLVILGDFVDMWRRDVSGIFLENHEILDLILELQQQGKTVYVAAGNHDYHLLKLDDHNYPFKQPFKDVFSLPIDGPDNPNYIFEHGWQFDEEQCPPIMELLCHNLSDDAGQVRSDIWDHATSFGQDLDKIKKAVEKSCGKISCIFENERNNYLQHLMTPPNQRKTRPFRNVEKRAATEPKPKGAILIFGHTHRPFVNAAKGLANAGSWVKGEKTFDTYLELNEKDIKLMQFDQTDVTNPIDITKKFPAPVY